MKKFGLIGKKLSHSFSPEYFQKKFSDAKLEDHSYITIELDDIRELRPKIARDTELKGFNVTIPYKQVIIPYLDKLSEEAKATGAVNTVSVDRTNGLKLYGYNTDVAGFSALLKQAGDIRNIKAMVLGNGGAAAAVCYSLDNHGIEHISIARKKIGQELLFHELHQYHYKEYLLVINCTPLGMYPNLNDLPPLNYEYLTQYNILIDLIYNPAETVFLQMGKKVDAVTINGLGMLYKQAEESWKIWNGNYV